MKKKLFLIFIICLLSILSILIIISSATNTINTDAQALATPTRLPTTTTPKNRVINPQCKMAVDGDCEKMKVQTADAESEQLRRAKLTPTIPPGPYPELGPASPPADVHDVYELPKSSTDRQAYRPNAVSVWHLGAVADDAKRWWSELYVLSDENIIRTEIIGVTYYSEVWPKYCKDWTPPQPLGIITITKATGVKGLLTFVSSSGHTGTFDMASEKWTIN